MESHDEIPALILAGSTGNTVDVTGRGQTGLATAPLAPSKGPGGIIRRRVVWAALAVVLGTAAFVYTRVNRPENCYRRALKALGRDDFDQARYDLPRLKGLPEYAPHASLINGILLLQEQKLDDALEEFRQAAHHPDTRSLALTLAGQTFLRQRRFAEGERALLTALNYDPNLAEAHGDLGAAYFDVGDVLRSMAHLAKAAELSPTDPRPYRFMASLHQSFRQDELAIEDLRESLRRGAANPVQMPSGMRQEVLLDLAQLQSQLLRHDEAMETLKDVDESPNSLALRAECQFALGDMEAARDSVAQALALDPNHFEALLAQGRLAMEAKDAALAVESLNRAGKLRPRSQTLHVLLSQALHVLGQDDVAEQHAEKASQLSELDQEYADLCNSAAREPRNALTCFRLGLLAERLGLDNEAACWYRGTILIEPWHASARERLSQLPGELAQRDGKP